MNKNPFVPQPSYTPQQPPLPPGPPPPQPAQPDYTAYWAAAAAQQQQQQQQHQAPPVPYNPQWSAPQPAQPRPTPEQNALYANYGYGGQAGLHWQQQQRQAQPGAQQPAVHYPAAPPVAQAPPPPPQPAYNPYQPTAGYPQPYIPQSAPPPQQPMAIQQPYPPPPQQQPQPYYPQPHPPPQQPQQQQQQPHTRANNHLHHTPPQQLPPAKRPRFENHPQNSRGGNQFQPPAQPQFQPPQPPPQQGPPMGMYGSGQNQGHGRGGAAQIGGGRGGAGGNRGSGGGGVSGGRGSGRGGSMSGNRGGSTGGRGGRGGNIFLGNNGGSGGRGGGSGQAVPLRGHGSRGFGNTKDYHNRRGGSFTSGGGHSHQNMGSSFRGGRGQNHSSGRGGRHDTGGGSSAFGARDGPMASSFSSNGKKDENRRTLTDFKIVGLEMRELGWTWGILPPPPPPPSVKAEAKEDASEGPDTSQVSVKQEMTETEVPLISEKVDDDVASESIVGSGTEAAPVESKPLANTATSLEVPTGPSKDARSSASTSAGSTIPHPPSRIRIYFHTPVSADDSHPISLNTTSSFSLGLAGPSDSRKGKRKKLEDDDGDPEEEGRGKRPPPPMGGGSQMSDTTSVDMDATGRGSVAPSVAETTSEGDWLMAAVVQEDANDGQDEDGNVDGGTDDKLNINNIEDNNDTEVGDNSNVGDDLVVTEGHGHLSENMDGQTDEENAHGSSGIESNGSVEAGPNSASAAIAAAVEGSKPSTVALGSVNTSSDVTAAKPTEGTTASDSDPRPAESETPTEPKDIPGSSTASNDTVSVVVAPDPAISGEEQSTNGYPDMQVPNLLLGGKPLQASASLASTVIDDDAQEEETGAFDEDGGVAVVNPDLSQHKPLVRDVEPEADSLEQEHLPEPPASPTSNTLLSTSSGSTFGEPGSQNTSTSLSAPTSPTKVDGKVVKTPSANRLSISYAAGSRRLVIDASVVEKLKVFRSDGRIEVYVNIEKDGEKGLKSILIEGLSETTKSYAPLPTLPSDDASPTDPTIPTFNQAPIPSQIILIAHLDTDRPLSEPKWVKSGDVQEWLKSMFGRMFWVAGDAADGWERKIEVVDPDPAPTIWTILESWSVNSPVGQQTERQRFLKTHMSSEPENILEILLRLVRGERATPFSGSSSSASITGSSISGPLLAALSGSSSGSASGGGFAHGEKQTHVSLAVLALWRMTLEYARKAAAASVKDGKGGDEEVAAVKEVEERVGEVIRCLPGHLVYKSLDGMFKEWRVEKKGGRG